MASTHRESAFSTQIQKEKNLVIVKYASHASSPQHNDYAVGTINFNQSLIHVWMIMNCLFLLTTK